MPTSPRMVWPYPKENQDPWYDTFTSLVLAMDASFYTTREDKNLILTGGGTLAFNSITGVFTWSEPFVAISVTSGMSWYVTDPSTGGTATLQDGEMLYVSLTRNPQTDQSVSVVVGSVLPPSDDLILLAIRRGAYVYLRNNTVVGVPGGGSILVFADIAAMAAYGMAGTDTGREGYLVTLRDYWSYDSSSTLTPDGITVVASASGGNWLREGTASPFWRAQPEFFIDPSTGADENDGLTNVTALATWAELLRRWGPEPMFDPALAEHVVRIRSSLPTTDPIFIPDVKSDNASFNLRIVGTLTSLRKGTVTSTTARVAGTGPLDLIGQNYTGTGTLTATTLTDGTANFLLDVEVGDQLLIIGGPNAGTYSITSVANTVLGVSPNFPSPPGPATYEIVRSFAAYEGKLLVTSAGRAAWVVLDEGGGGGSPYEASLSRPYTVAGSDTPIAVSETYRIYDSLLTVRFAGSHSHRIVQFETLDVDILGPSLAPVFFWGCGLQGTVTGGAYFLLACSNQSDDLTLINCYSTALGHFVGPDYEFLAASGGSVFLSFTMQGTGGGTGKLVLQGGYTAYGDIGLVDTPGIAVDGGAHRQANGVWVQGGHTADYFLRAQGGGVVTVGADLGSMFTGTPTAPFRVGSQELVDVSYLPFTDPADSSSIHNWEYRRGTDGPLDSRVQVSPGVNQNDYAPGGNTSRWLRAEYVELDPSADITISGFVAILSDFRTKILTNVSATNTVTLLHDNGGSSLLNRMQIRGQSDLVLQPRDSVRLYYTPTGYWTVVGLSAPVLTDERFPGVSGSQSTDVNTFVGVGAIVLDPSVLSDLGTDPLTLTFRAVIETTSALLPVEVRLYNITAAAVVAGTTLTSSSLTPDLQVSAALTLPASEQVYEVQLRMNGVAGPTDLVTCKMAEIRATWG